MLTQQLLKWFSQHGRKLPWRKSIVVYNVLVAEKLLQQTSYGHVLKAYANFLKKYPTVEALAASDKKEIERIIKSLGFQHQRAIQFKEMAEKIINDFAGKIPSSRSLLLTLSGVGNYIADAVLCYAYGEEIVPVDVNVRRVARRLFEWEKKPTDQEIQEKMTSFIPKEESRTFNWALLDFAAKICSRVPKCEVCIVKSICHYYNKI